ncbi:MAG: 2-oxoacid:acceptor oxidoreductase subunit alpha [Anaerolineales bacterium]|nr:2-oxoacid:acceptor oxidoreductase subunit alpha [Chloroflexota bacterium]MBL6979997.1 2-oxoacid:acceptor oxidoreductase subunit alpha [Anaerolineales bacterium]
MTTVETKIQSNKAIASGSVVNDFSISVATMNGSGSQTSNLTLLRALFKMGIPVSGKNLFPSNIQGLPTWYTIRVSKDGYLARTETIEVMVAMNATTFAKDQAALVPGGVFFYADDIKQAITRKDIVAYPMPVKKLAKESDAPASLRTYVANMVYVGVLVQMLGINPQRIEQALDFHFKGKEKPIKLNLDIIKKAAEWAEENLQKSDPYYLEDLDLTEGQIMASGNTAGALGSIYGGVQFVSWYPITPASSLAESCIEYLPMLRTDPETGKNTYAVVQAEDELAAIGMAVGAGWGGLRSMTSTSGPGISLMTEYASMAYYAETPVVIWNVQRMGPSTGLPTRTSQGDINLTYYLGHGDTKHIVLLPGSVNECFELGWKAFDLAERFQTPVFLLSDLDMGMNQWMTSPFKYPDKEIDRGKVLWEEDFEGLEIWGRYLDIDGDGIPYRTLPGNRHSQSGYFARGTGHDEFANYTEDPDVWVKGMDRLLLKFEHARSVMPQPEIVKRKGATIGVIAFGSTDPAIREAIDYMSEEDLEVDYLRLRALPVVDEVRDFIRKYEHVYVVEMNRDGQLHQILSLEVPERATHLISLTHNDGLPLTATWIKGAILGEERN